MDTEFVDIRVVDLDLRRTTWSRVHESMRVVFLRLNGAPPDLEWTRLFNEERESRINLRRCGLWIEDDTIGFDCLLHEVEAHHLPDIQRSIDYANRRYREVLGQRDRARREWSDESQAETTLLKSLRSRVQAAAQASSAPAAPEPVAPAPVVAMAAPGGVDTPAFDAPASEFLNPLSEPPIALPPPPAVTTLAELPALEAADDAAFDRELELRRQLLRERYRAALTAKTKETSRGND